MFLLSYVFRPWYVILICNDELYVYNMFMLQKVHIQLLLLFMMQEKESFVAILRKMCRVQKIGGISYIIEARDWSCDGKQARMQSRLEKNRAVRKNIHQSLK